mgnify:CR=1 FL=1
MHHWAETKLHFGKWILLLKIRFFQGWIGFPSAKRTRLLAMLLSIPWYVNCPAFKGSRFAFKISSHFGEERRILFKGLMSLLDQVF